MKINSAVLFLLLLTVSFGSACKAVSKMLGQGTEFVVAIETDEPDKQAILQRAIKTTEGKINAAGLTGDVRADPENSDRMIVRLYGEKDLERAKGYLFTSYRLELRKVVSPPNPSPVQRYPDEASAQKVATEDQQVLVFSQRGDLRSAEATEPHAQFLIVEKKAVVTGDDIRDASAVSRSGKGSEYQIAFSFKPDAAARFGDWTNRNINNYIAVVLNSKVVSTAFIKSQIFDSGQIDGRFTKEQAEDVALSLKSGYLPATLRVVDERPVK